MFCWGTTCYQGKTYGFVKFVIYCRYFEQIKLMGCPLHNYSSISNTVLAHYSLLSLGCALRKIEQRPLL